MPSVSGVIPNVIGGISQQPPAARLENTAGDLRNALPSVVSGLRKRPPFRFGADLGPAPAGNFASFLLERPGKVLKTVTVAEGVLKVFSEDGTEEPVTTTGDVSSYLTASDPETAFGFLAIGDSVFVYNKTVTVTDTVASDSRPDPQDNITFVINQSALNTGYVLTLQHKDGTRQQGFFNLGDGGGGPTDADYIASRLADAFNSAGDDNAADGKPRVTAVHDRNCLRISGATDWSIHRTRPAALTTVYRDSVQRFVDLPPFEINGRLVKVAGNPDDTVDTYWVEYNNDTGLWEETFGYQQGRKFDKSTMPHILRDNGDGTWTFGPHDWKDRGVGDDDSNAAPSFVGYTIRSMFLASNRMCILSDENLIASEVGEYETFYRTTCTTLLDSDRLDVAAVSSEARVSQLYHAIEFDDQLLLFSDGAQYRLDNSQGMSPHTINLRLSTSYNSSTICRPVRFGTNVLFVDDADNGAWADIREYLVDHVVGVNSSEIITKQVPEFVPTGVHLMAANPTLGTTAVLSRNRRDRLYLYSSYWSDGNRLQSSWCYWDDPNYSFRHAMFVGNRLYVIVVRDGRLLLLWCNMQETVEGDFNGVEVLLDNRVLNPEVTFDGTDSHITLPYRVLPGEVYTIVLTEDGADRMGSVYNIEEVEEGFILRVPDVDLTTSSFLVGKRYTFLYELSPFFLRDQGKVPIQDGRLQIRYVSFLYHLSSFFEVLVKHPGREAFRKTFTARTLGRIANKFGDVVVENGSFRVPVSAQAQDVTITVVNDSPFNCRFSSIEWEGIWRPRTERMR